MGESGSFFFVLVGKTRTVAGTEVRIFTRLGTNLMTMNPLHPAERFAGVDVSKAHLYLAMGPESTVERFTNDDAGVAA